MLNFCLLFVGEINFLFNFQNSTGEHFRSPRRNMRSSIEGQSDESETSSVCSERSERSFDSFKRPCDVSIRIFLMHLKLLKISVHWFNAMD